jgi:hypothetical protein
MQLTNFELHADGKVNGKGFDEAGNHVWVGKHENNQFIA